MVQAVPLILTVIVVCAGVKFGAAELIAAVVAVYGVVVPRLNASVSAPWATALVRFKYWFMAIPN